MWIEFCHCNIGRQVKQETIGILHLKNVWWAGGGAGMPHSCLRYQQYENTSHHRHVIKSTRFAPIKSNCGRLYLSVWVEVTCWWCVAVCALSPNTENCFLAYPANASNGEIMIFDAEKCQAINIIQAHKSLTTVLAFNFDGTLLATASDKVSPWL